MGIIKQIVKAVDIPLGLNSTVKRTIGIKALRHLSPFLLLDDFETQPNGGFPDHAHHGQQTITYVLNGCIEHEDSAGSKGRLGPGSFQFMTAGRGIMHSERADPKAPTSGLQLWVDLDRNAKDGIAFYNDLPSSDIETVKLGSKSYVRIISGEYNDHRSRRNDLTAVWYLTFRLTRGIGVNPKWPKNWNAFVYLVDGRVRIGSDLIEKNELAVLGSEAFAEITSQDNNTHILFAAGRPLDHEIYQDGLFVETSKERLRKVKQEYGTLTGGFEHARGWTSTNGPAQATKESKS
jgi:redox-sensitive bicupin YhaK (pirin superfamily)